MKPHHPLLNRLILVAALILLTGLPCQPVQAAPKTQGQYNMAVFILSPLVDLYEGDTITLPYMVEDLAASGGITLAPLTPGTASVTASLGTASVSPDGLGGSITYTAQKPGQEELVLTVGNYFGTATGSISLKIKPRPNYDLDFFVVSQHQDEAGAFFIALFIGEGEFANQPGSAIEGRGSSELWFSLGAVTQAFACQMDPPIQGSSDFMISGTPNLVVPLVPTPGFQESFFLDLVFAPMPLNGTTIVCEGLGDISMNVSLPATTSDPNEHNLKSLQFFQDGGIVPIQAPMTSGLIVVTRKES